MAQHHPPSTRAVHPSEQSRKSQASGWPWLKAGRPHDRAASLAPAATGRNFLWCARPDAWPAVTVGPGCVILDTAKTVRTCSPDLRLDLADAGACPRPLTVVQAVRLASGTREPMTCCWSTPQPKSSPERDLAHGLARTRDSRSPSSIQPVSTGPGLTSFAVMPAPASSRAAAITMRSSAPSPAPYGELATVWSLVRATMRPPSAPDGNRWANSRISNQEARAFTAT